MNTKYYMKKCNEKMYCGEDWGGDWGEEIMIRTYFMINFNLNQKV